MQEKSVNTYKDLKMANKYRDALKNARLYLILDTEVQSYNSLLEIAQSAIQHGVDIVQFRDKKGTAKNILKFSDDLLKWIQHNSMGKQIPFIINDRVDLALVSGACGVHLGQEDVPAWWARKILGPHAIIGVSCQTLKQAQLAQHEGADYIGFGSVFKTKTKPERSAMELKLLAEVIRKIKIPVFAIGGIDSEKILKLHPLGVNRIAVCRAVCEAKNIPGAVRGLMEALDVH